MHSTSMNRATVHHENCAIGNKLVLFLIFRTHKIEPEYSAFAHLMIKNLNVLIIHERTFASCSQPLSIYIHEQTWSSLWQTDDSKRVYTFF